MDRDLYLQLNDFIHARSWAASFEDPHWYHETIPALLGESPDYDLSWRNVKALYYLVKDLQAHLGKNTMPLKMWFIENDKKPTNQTILHEQRNYLFKVLTETLEEQGIDEYYWTKILYNCSS